MPALLAYAQLAAQQVSGAPVVTDTGELIANLSISDLRCVRLGGRGQRVGLLDAFACSLQLRFHTIMRAAILKRTRHVPTGLQDRASLPPCRTTARSAPACHHASPIPLFKPGQLSNTPTPLCQGHHR